MSKPIFVEVPDIERYPKEAFSTAETATGFKETALYPVTNRIVAVFKKGDEKDLSFPKMVSFLIKKGYEKFLAVKDYGEQVDVFVYFGNDRFKYYSFDYADAPVGILSILRKYFSGAGREDFVIVFEGGERTERLKRELLKVYGVERNNTTELPEIEPGRNLVMVETRVLEEDYANLLEKFSFSELKKRIVSYFSGKRTVAVAATVMVAVSVIAATGYWAYHKIEEKKLAEKRAAELKERNELLKKAREEAAKRIKFNVAPFLFLRKADPKGDFFMAADDEKIYFVSDEPPLNNPKLEYESENFSYTVYERRGFYPFGETVPKRTKKSEDFEKEFSRIGCGPKAAVKGPERRFFVVICPYEEGTFEKLEDIVSRMKGKVYLSMKVAEGKANISMAETFDDASSGGKKAGYSTLAANPRAKRNPLGGLREK